MRHLGSAAWSDHTAHSRRSDPNRTGHYPEGLLFQGDALRKSGPWWCNSRGPAHGGIFATIANLTREGRFTFTLGRGLSRKLSATSSTSHTYI